MEKKIVRLSPDSFIIDVIDGRLNYSYKGGVVFHEATPLLENEYFKHFGQRLTKINERIIKDIIDAIKSTRNEDSNIELWDLFHDEQLERFKNLTPGEPLLLSFYKPGDLANVVNVICSIIKRKARPMFILHGVSGAGKSLIIDSLIALFGRYQTVKQMTDFNGQFTLDGIQNKLLVQCNDLGKEQVTDRASGRFKQICDGSEVNIERKGKREEIIKPNFNLLFGCNVLPQFNIQDAGNLTRGAYVWFGSKIELKQDYHKIKKQLLSEQELCNLYFFAMRTNIDNKLIERLIKAWEDKQLERTRKLIPSKDVSYANYKQNCNESEIKPCDLFEFEYIRSVLFGGDIKPANMFNDDELPF